MYKVIEVARQEKGVTVSAYAYLLNTNKLILLSLLATRVSLVHIRFGVVEIV